MSIEFATEVVDNGGGVVGPKALAVDPSGTPHIVYVANRPVGNLFLASRTLAGWVHEPVDSIAIQDSKISFAIVPNGTYHLAYRQHDSGLPMYASRTSGPWTFETVPTGVFMPAVEAISMDVNHDPRWDHDPYVAFTTVVDGDQLSVARKTNGSWKVTFIEPPSIPGRTVNKFSISIDWNDVPFIDYFVETEEDFHKLLKTANVIPSPEPGGEPRWQVRSWPENVDANDTETIILSLSSMHGFSRSVLAWGIGGKLKVWRNSVTGEPPILETIASGAGNVNYMPSVALDIFEKHRVAFADVGGDVKLASMVDPGPTQGGWIIERIDSGNWPSLAYDNANNAHIAYHAGGNLMYAKGAGSSSPSH